jgi:hypothetical protein
VSAPTEDDRKRATRDGRNWHQCGRCERQFLVHGTFGSQRGSRITVCGVILDPPEPRCLLTVDGEWWWPEDEPVPDLVEIDRHNRAAKLQPMR